LTGAPAGSGTWGTGVAAVIGKPTSGPQFSQFRGGDFMRRHDKQAVAVLAFLFLVSIAIGLHAWL
jgi:hypothetical protein